MPLYSAIDTLSRWYRMLTVAGSLTPFPLFSHQDVRWFFFFLGSLLCVQALCALIHLKNIKCLVQKYAISFSFVALRWCGPSLIHTTGVITGAQPFVFVWLQGCLAFSVTLKIDSQVQISFFVSWLMFSAVYSSVFCSMFFGQFCG